MTAAEIYATYKIFPMLQMHQLRVAAVGKQIAQNCDGRLDERSIVTACLFHDMGNIIKVDFSRFPESFEPQGLAYWQHVQEDFVRRYGPDEHHATIAIAHELHLPLQALKYIDGVGFSKLEHTRDSHSFEQKIVEYADLRVAPLGVVSMTERLQEAKKRYETRHSDMPKESARYDELATAAAEVERQIFAKTRIRPEEITDSSIAPLIDDLRRFQVA